MSSSITNLAKRLLCSLLIFSISPVPFASAEGSHCDPDYVPVVDWPSPCSFELGSEEVNLAAKQFAVQPELAEPEMAANDESEPDHCNAEICGWVEIDEPSYEIMAPMIVGLGTHDTVALPSMAVARISNTTPATSIEAEVSELEDHAVKAAATNREVAAKKDSSSARSSESNVAALTTTVLSVAGVKVQQVIEPFALVASEQSERLMQNQIASVDLLSAWWLQVQEVQRKNDAEAANAIDEPSMTAKIEKRISRLAQSEPVDAASIEVQPIAEASDIAVASVEPAIQVADLDYLVGSGPMVVTIRESYLPYDLSSSDRQLWDTYATAARPFCVRDQFRNNQDPLALSDADAEIAMAKAKEVIQWILGASQQIAELTAEAAESRLAEGSSDSQSL